MTLRARVSTPAAAWAATSAAGALAAAALAVAAVGCRWLRGENRVEPFRCDDPAVVCPAGRVCRATESGERFCVVEQDAGTGQDGSDAMPPCECDDGQPCNGTETCSLDGTCIAGTPPDCSAFDSACWVGICHPLVGKCVPSARPDGSACDDGVACTAPDYCTSGACGGEPMRCGNGCDDSCDPATGLCGGPPLADGDPCNDGEFCTVGETCEAGACTPPPAPRSCDDSEACTTDACDETADGCTHDAAVHEGEPCDDGASCTTNDVCQGGFCTGAPNGCEEVKDDCNVGSCSELTGCEPLPLPNDTPCDDGDAATAGDHCYFGNCVGT